jgi:DNA-binding CsgD family transcriptional regulator
MALGMIEYMLAHTNIARQHLEAALEIAVEQRNLIRQHGIRMALVTVLAELGEIQAAGVQLEGLRLLNLQLERGSDPRNSGWLLAAASIAVNEGLHLRAARLVGAAHGTDAATENGSSRTTRALVDRFAQKSKRALGDAWEEAVREGARLEVDAILEAPEPPAKRAADALSAREFEIVALVAEGLSDAEIANRLGIRPRTVSTHLTSVYNKFGVRSRTQAVREARQRGLLETTA